MPKKALGQHFLSDPRILARIADALGPGGSETILEIGPGRGDLTGILAGRFARVVAIEKDRELVPWLRSRLPRVEIIEGDALELDWQDLPGRPTMIIGNIPYNITSPLIDKALTPPRPRAVVFLVQKEVADRLAAPPGGPEYGALSVGVQAVARVERLFRVPAGAFQPPPRVDSAVVRLTPLDHPMVADHDIPAFRTFVVGLFGFRRKQVVRGLRELTGQSPPMVLGWLSAAGIASDLRPQAISPARFVALFPLVKSYLART